MKSIKSIISIFTVLFFLGLTSCGGGTKKSCDGTHTHEDGSTHHDHATEAAQPAEQESFNVEADSTATTTDPAHDHDHGHDHDHSDGKAHKH